MGTVTLDSDINGYSLPIGASLTKDAWGVNKVSQDHSLLSIVYTYEVPQEFMKETVNGVEQAFTQATSSNGIMNLASNGVLNDVVALETFRNPRYQPNRGHHYASSIFLPSPNAAGQRDWGTFTAESGLFFRLRGDGASWRMYFVSRTTVNSVTTDTENDITDFLPNGFDPEKGNIYDYQAQMRMVGNFNVFVGDPNKGLLSKVHEVKNLNTLTELSVFNPAMPICYAVENQGADVTLQSGCVDISTEGGTIPKGFYGSVSFDNQAGQVAISGFNVPIIATRNLSTFNSLINTRDFLALVATAYGDQRCVFRVWSTRDQTAITLNDQSWVGFRDGHLEYVQYDNPNVTTPMTFDTTKATLVFGARVDQDQTYETSAQFNGKTSIYQTPGDIFVFTMHRETGGAANVGVTYEFAEEV